MDYEGLRVDDLYHTLDWLHKRKERIEAKLYRQRQNPTLFLYDITSLYSEGEKGELLEFGYSREGKREV